MIKTSFAAAILSMLLTANAAVAYDPVSIVVDGRPAASWRVCIEDMTETPGPGFPPACFDSNQTLNDQFQWPDYPYHIIVYAAAPPEKITLETAVRALRVVAGEKNQ